MDAVLEQLLSQPIIVEVHVAAKTLEEAAKALLPKWRQELESALAKEGEGQKKDDERDSKDTARPDYGASEPTGQYGVLATPAVERMQAKRADPFNPTEVLAPKQEDITKPYSPAFISERFGELRETDGKNFRAPREPESSTPGFPAHSKLIG